MADDTETEQKPSTTTEALIKQINTDLDKKEREAVKAKMGKIVGEIREAEKLIRMKSAELQKLQQDYENGILT